MAWPEDTPKVLKSSKKLFWQLLTKGKKLAAQKNFVQNHYDDDGVVNAIKELMLQWTQLETSAFRVQNDLWAKVFQKCDSWKIWEGLGFFGHFVLWVLTILARLRKCLFLQHFFYEAKRRSKEFSYRNTYSFWSLVNWQYFPQNENVNFHTRELVSVFDIFDWLKCESPALYPRSKSWKRGKLEKFERTLISFSSFPLA